MTKKPKPSDLLEMHNKGMMYKDIAKKYGMTKNAVAGAILRYRKKHGLKAPNKQPPRKGKGNYRNYEAVELKKRKEAEKNGYRRDDGVLVCPPRHCDGFGFDISGRTFI